MNLRGTVTVYLKELKDSLRDRRTLVSMIVIPALVMPMIMIGVGTVMAKVIHKARQETPSIMILGGEDSPGIVAALRTEKNRSGQPRFQIVEHGDYRELISAKRLRAAVEIPPGFEASLAAGDPKTVTIYHYEGEIRSSLGQAALRDFFDRLRDTTVARRLAERGFPPDFIHPFSVERRNVAPPEKVGGNLIGGFVPYLVIILCFTGAMYPAMDLTAGEKERGTMETLLCSPIPRSSIVGGKFLAVLTASIATMLTLLASSSITLFVGGSLFAPRAAAIMRDAAGSSGALGGLAPTLDPLGILGVFAMIAPVAVLFSALLLAVSLFAKSYKEAQSYVSPMVIVVILPAIIGMLPGIDLTARTALVPILNLSLACKEMLSGVWHWRYIALIFASSCAYAVLALAFCVRMFNRESVMFRA